MNSLMLGHLSARDMTNDTLRRFARTGSPAMEKLTRPAPVEPSPMDWTTDYLCRQLVGLSWQNARQIITAVLAKRRQGKTLTNWEERVFEAYDRVAQESR